MSRGASTITPRYGGMVIVRRDAPSWSDLDVFEDRTTRTTTENVCFVDHPCE